MTKRNLIQAAAFAGFFLAASTASAGDSTILLNQVQGKGGTVLSVDLVSGGDVSAFQYLITLPADAKGVNTSKCLADLPKTHTGICRAKGNRVAVVIYSADNKPLPGGAQGIGMISYDSLAKAAPEVSKMVASSSKGGSAGSIKAEFAGSDTHDK